MCSAGQVGRCIETPWNHGAGWNPAGSLVAFKALMGLDFHGFSSNFSTCVCVLSNPLKCHALKATGWILGSQSAAKVGVSISFCQDRIAYLTVLAACAGARQWDEVFLMELASSASEGRFSCYLQSCGKPNETYPPGNQYEVTLHFTSFQIRICPVINLNGG